MDRVDSLLGRLLSVRTERKVEFTGRLRWRTTAEGQIPFRDLAAFEQAAESYTRLAMTGKQEHPRRVPIEAMHRFKWAKLIRKTNRDTHRVSWSASGHTRHARWLVDRHQPRVGVEHREERGH